MSENQKHAKPNVPNLRFPGFEGEWERQSLGEVGEPFIGLTYSPSDVVSEGGTIVFRSSNIQNGEIDYSDIVRVNKKLKESIITRKDDLLICARNGSPRLIGKNALLKESDANQTFGAFMLVYRSPYNHFIHQLLATKKYYSQVSENLGARINQITTANIKEFEFFFPNGLEERDKISKFLDLVDQRIAIQSRVIEDLKKLKAAIEDRCFNQFKGESVRLADILIERNEKSVRNNQYEVLSSTVSGIYSQREYFNKEIASADNTGYKVIRRGDIVLSPQNLWMGNINYNDKFDIGIVSPSYKVFSIMPMFNKRFVASLLKSKKALWEYSLVSEQGASVVRRNLSTDGFMGIAFPIPDKEKQNMIGDMFAAVNNRIGLEKSILDDINKQKFYLLNQLFI